MQATRELRSTGINVSRTASGGHAGVATTFFALSVRPQLPRARAAMKNGDRDLKRGIRVSGLGLEGFWARVEELFASVLLAVLTARAAARRRPPPSPGLSKRTRTIDPTKIKRDKSRNRTAGE